VQLGLENKKKTMWAAVLAVLAILALVYQFIPLLTSPSSPGASAQAAAPAAHVVAHTGTRPARKERPESLDPTLRLELLATAEQTQYQGTGRNIFISQAESVVIPRPGAPGVTDRPMNEDQPGYRTPPPPQQTPIPLQFYGFASRAGEPKKVFLKLGDDVWVAAEGEIVDRRYKVIRISPTSVEIQDVVNSGPPQTIQLTQG